MGGYFSNTCPDILPHLPRLCNHLDEVSFIVENELPAARPVLFFIHAMNEVNELEKLAGKEFADSVFIY